MINQGIDSADEINLNQELDEKWQKGSDFINEDDDEIKTQNRIFFAKRRSEMKTYDIEVKAKIGALEIPKTFSYDEPEDWASAIEMSDKGEASEFKVYLIKRKTNFMDKHRSEMVKNATKKLGALSIEKLREIGLDV